jgi:hypothetical protein
VQRVHARAANLRQIASPRKQDVAPSQTGRSNFPDVILFVFHVFAANFFASIFPAKNTKMNRSLKQLAEKLMAERFLPSTIKNAFLAHQAGSFMFLPSIFLPASFPLKTRNDFVLYTRDFRSNWLRGDEPRHLSKTKA